MNSANARIELHPKGYALLFTKPDNSSRYVLLIQNSEDPDDVWSHEFRAYMEPGREEIAVLDELIQSDPQGFKGFAAGKKYLFTVTPLNGGTVFEDITFDYDVPGQQDSQTSAPAEGASPAPSAETAPGTAIDVKATPVGTATAPATEEAPSQGQKSEPVKSLAAIPPVKTFVPTPLIKVVGLEFQVATNPAVVTKLRVFPEKANGTALCPHKDIEVAGRETFSVHVRDIIADKNALKAGDRVKFRIVALDKDEKPSTGSFMTPFMEFTENMINRDLWPKNGNGQANSAPKNGDKAAPGDAGAKAQAGQGAEQPQKPSGLIPKISMIYPELIVSAPAAKRAVVTGKIEGVVVFPSKEVDVSAQAARIDVREWYTESALADKLKEASWWVVRFDAAATDEHGNKAVNHRDLKLQRSKIKEITQNDEAEPEQDESQDVVTLRNELEEFKEQLEGRLKSLEGSSKDAEGEIGKLKKKIGEVEGQIKALDRKMGESFEAAQKNADEKHDELVELIRNKGGQPGTSEGGKPSPTPPTPKTEPESNGEPEEPEAETPKAQKQSDGTNWTVVLVVGGALLLVALIVIAGLLVFFSKQAKEIPYDPNLAVLAMKAPAEKQAAPVVQSGNANVAGFNQPIGEGTHLPDGFEITVAPIPVGPNTPAVQAPQKETPPAPAPQAAPPPADTEKHGSTEETKPNPKEEVATVQPLPPAIVMQPVQPEVVVDDAVGFQPTRRRFFTSTPFSGMVSVNLSPSYGSYGGHYTRSHARYGCEPVRCEPRHQPRYQHYRNNSWCVFGPPQSACKVFNPPQRACDVFVNVPGNHGFR